MRLSRQLWRWSLAVEFEAADRLAIPVDEQSRHLGRGQYPRFRQCPLLALETDGPAWEDRAARSWQALAQRIGELILCVEAPVGDDLGNSQDGGAAEYVEPRRGAEGHYRALLLVLESWALPPAANPQDADEEAELSGWRGDLEDIRNKSKGELSYLREAAHKKAGAAGRQATRYHSKQWKAWLRAALEKGAGPARRQLRANVGAPLVQRGRGRAALHQQRRGARA